DRDKASRAPGLVREDRKPAVDLRRIGRDQLGRNSLADRLGDRTLARGGRPEDPEYEAPPGRSAPVRSGHPGGPPRFHASEELRTRLCRKRAESASRGDERLLRAAEGRR